MQFYGVFICFSIGLWSATVCSLALRKCNSMVLLATLSVQELAFQLYGVVSNFIWAFGQLIDHDALAPGCCPNMYPGIAAFNTTTHRLHPDFTLKKPTRDIVSPQQVAAFTPTNHRLHPNKSPIEPRLHPNKPINAHADLVMSEEDKSPGSQVIPVILDHPTGLSVTISLRRVQADPDANNCRVPRNFLTPIIDAGFLYSNVDAFLGSTLRASPTSCKMRTNMFAMGTLNLALRALPKKKPSFLN